MNRSNIIKRLVKEGMTEKTLANFSDKQIMVLAKRMLSEQSVGKGSVVMSKKTTAPSEIKRVTDGGVNVELREKSKGGQKKLSKKQSETMDTDKDGDIDIKDLRKLRAKKLKENFNDTRYHKYEEAPDDDVDYGDGPEYAIDDFDDFQPEDDNAIGVDRENVLHRIYRQMNTGLGKTRSNVYTVKPDDVRQFPPSSDMVSEGRRKPSVGLSAKKKSSVVKAARMGKDIGKKGKGFKEVVAKAKAGGARNPKAVAAAAMWKNVVRESVLNENKNKIDVILKLDDSSLKKFKTIPTFKDMLSFSQLKDLKVGENKLTVNHTIWGKLQRMEGPGGYSVKKSVKESNEVNNWLKALVETEYHPFTSKGEIMELIQTKLDERGGRNMIDGDMPDFLSYDAIVNAEPAVAPVTKPEKPKVVPSRPTRERPNERPKPFNPYQPGPGTNPKPKMRK